MVEQSRKPFLLLLLRCSPHTARFPVTRNNSRSVSGSCESERCSPWSTPFPPQPPSSTDPRCSAGSKVISRSPTPPKRACPHRGLRLLGPASISTRPRRFGGLPVLVHVVSQRARGLRLHRTGEPLASNATRRVAFHLHQSVGILKQRLFEAQ
jgi:hypothetical protein